MPQLPDLKPAISADKILTQDRMVLGIPLGKIKDVNTVQQDKLRGVSVPDSSGDLWKESRDLVHVKVMDALDANNPKRDAILVEAARILKFPAEVKILYEGYLINKSSPGYSSAEVALLEAAARVVAIQEADTFIKGISKDLEQEVVEWVADRKISLEEQRHTQEQLRGKYSLELDALNAEVGRLEQEVKQLEEAFPNIARKDYRVMREKLSPYGDLMEDFVKAVRAKHKDDIGAMKKAGQRFRKPEFPFDADEMLYVNRQLKASKNFLAEALTDAEGNTIEVNTLHRETNLEAELLASDQQLINYVGKYLGSILQVGGYPVFPGGLSENALDAISSDSQSAVTRLAVSMLILHPEITIKDENLRPVLEAARQRVADNLVSARVDEIKRNNPKYKETIKALEENRRTRDITSYNFDQAVQMVRRTQDEEKGLEGPGKVVSHVSSGLENIARSLGAQNPGMGEIAIREQIAADVSSLMLARLANEALFYNSEQSANYRERRPARFAEIRKTLYGKLLSPDQADPKTREALQDFFSAYDETVIRAQEFVDKKRWEEAQGVAMRQILHGANLALCQMEDRASLMETLSTVKGISNEPVRLSAVPTQTPGNNIKGELIKDVWLARSGDGFVISIKYAGNPTTFFHFDIGKGQLGCRVADSLTDPGRTRDDGGSISNVDIFNSQVGMGSESILLIKEKL